MKVLCTWRDAMFVLKDHINNPELDFEDLLPEDAKFLQECANKVEEILETGVNYVK